VGSAGSIFVREADTVSLNNSTISTAVNPGAEGEGGNVEIATDSLSLDNNAQISASTSGVGNAGGVLVQAQDAISLRDGSQISSTVESTAVGNGREIQLQARTLSLTNGAQVNASTSGQGDAGSIRVNTTEAVSLSGDNSRLSTSTNSSGSGGSITVDTGAFRVSERAVLDATTSNAGNGGNITVNSHSFDATDGGKLQASTSGSGRAGDITVDIADRMRVDGTDSGLFASTTASSTGNGGDVRIEAGSASLTDGAQVSASTSGQGSSGNIQLDVPDGELLVKDGAEVTVSGLSGQAGNLTVTADSIRLENEGKLTAVTGVGEGGNITLRDVDLLLMRDRSEISAEARGTANGGNITIDANFIVAVPSENSDITANAVEGNGGRVSITAQGLFGIEFREQRTPLSDITASSEFGVDGVVEINAPEVDPSRGLTALPAEVVDASNQIAQNCPASGGTVAQSELIVTGRGGLPDNPIEALSSDAVWTDLRPTTRATGRVEEGARGRISPTSSTTEAPKQLVEAQGWIINDKGKVVLTAQAVPVVPHSPWHKPADCPVK
jgi:large exoprotein involved in heme utilization and adhesion